MARESRHIQTAGDGIVTSIPSYSKYLGQAGNPNDGAYTYTGKILPVKASVYDYLTDAEISTPSTWNQLSDGAYTYYNRYNPYNTFDTAVSNMASPGTSTIPHENNVTIKFHSTNITSPLYVHLWNSNDTSKYIDYLMEYDSGTSDFAYTFILSDLNFVPDSLIFCNYSVP
ncbi:MAG: hypothetical protein IIT46_16340 [Lachnospiraceae bacterium]|nr:hypothetical protein [Lachnospiraceae bacterium]